MTVIDNTIIAMFFFSLIKEENVYLPEWFNPSIESFIILLLILFMSSINLYLSLINS